LGHRPRSQRSIEPEKAAGRIRSLGDSPRDETGYPMNRKQEIDCKVQSKSR